MNRNNICFLPFIRKYAVFNTRFEFHLKRFDNRFATYFDNADAVHIMAMSLIRIKILNFFQNIVSINIDWWSWVFFFFFFFFENDKRTLLELSLMMHWSAKKDLKNSAFSHKYFDKTVTEYTEFFVIWKCLQNWPIRLCTNDWIHHLFSYRWVVFLLIFFNWESQLNLEIFNCIK